MKEREALKGIGGVKDFNNLIEELELYDLPVFERKYTWFDSQHNHRWSMIDFCYILNGLSSLVLNSRA